jgi:hypothetical protein
MGFSVLRSNLLLFAAYILAVSLIPAISATITSPWTIISAPTKEVKQDTTVTIMVASRTTKDTLKAGCGIYFSSASIGPQKAGHIQKVTRWTDSEGPFKSRVLTFRPSSPDTTTVGNPPQMPLGIQYLVVACPDTSNMVTPEIPLKIVATQAPSFITPLSVETNARPQITWTAVPGVPAYHLLLSDQELKIDPTAGSVSGASIIWQAIVTGTSITYGLYRIMSPITWSFSITTTARAPWPPPPEPRDCVFSL